MSKRVVTDDDIKKYEPLVESFIRNNVVKNWNEASRNPREGEISLGNTGRSLNDIRQFLRTEVFIALTKYNPDHITPDGKSVKELTFVHTHLFTRVGQLMKKLTKKSHGYGFWSSKIDVVLREHDEEA